MNRTIKRAAVWLFDLYLNSSLHVALAVTSLTLVSYRTLNLPPDHALLLFIFFSSVFGYNATKYGESLDRISSPARTAVRWITAAALAISVVLAFWLSLYVIAAAALLGFITMSYSWPLLFSQTTLREISGIKIFVIAFVWSSVSVGLPVLEAGAGMSTTIALEYVQRLLFVLVLTLPFDIRDIRFDTHQLGTIPQSIGIKKTRALGIGLLSLATILGAWKDPLNSIEAILFGAVALLTGVMVMKTAVKQTRYFASFWVEGIPILWWLLLLLFT
ncbi:MAG: hypothetical protein GVY08_11620 [Bacteroidetes bacterium]|jgi:hypothetical protein|nr:hypothetical protein [Bacteroidota bacterium]